MGVAVYDPKDHVDDLVAWLEEGKTLRAFCRQAGRPSYGTIYAWERSDKALAARIARAREIGRDAIAEEALEIIDDGSRDWLDASAVQRDKARAELRLKLLAKWDPRKWGEKVAVGGDPDGAPIRTLTTVERAHRLQVLLTRVAARQVTADDPEVRELLS